MADLADQDRAAAVRRPIGSSTSSAPETGSTPSARTGSARAVRTVEVRPPARSSAGGPSSRRRRSVRARSASTPGLQAARRTRRPGRRGRSGRPSDASRSDVIVSASSGGKTAAGQSALMPMPTTTRGSSRARGRRSRRGRRPACGASRRPPRRRGRWATSGGSSPRAGRRPPRPRRPSPARRPRPAARRGPGGSQSGRNPSDSSSAAPGGATQRPPVTAAAGRLLVGDRQADLGRAVGQPVAHDVVRRADDRRIAPSGPGIGSVASHGCPQPAAATSTGSGRSSSKASCRARSAVSSSSSATMQVMRTSDVEIISMLTPASARVPNIRAA